MKFVIMITFDRHGTGTFSHWWLEWLDKRDKTKNKYQTLCMVVHYGGSSYNLCFLLFEYCHFVVVRISPTISMAVCQVECVRDS